MPRESAKSSTPESDIVATIAAMPEADRVLAERLQALLAVHAPELMPRLWYGMPAWAREGKVVCFFQGAAKFKTRYATLGFQHAARLDEGAMWPVAFALIEWTAEVEERLVELVKRAVSGAACG